MDIAAISTMISQSQIKQQASFSVLKIAMNAGKMQMQGLTEMMEQNTKQIEHSINPNLGKNIDISI